MKAFDLYGISGLSIDEARRILELALGMEMKPHESEFHGGEYYRSGDANSEHFVLKDNVDGDELAEPDFPEASLLLYVNKTLRGDEIADAIAAISGIKLLRREML